jgi:NAD(P)-dependent dehydrogenase (short-subunit alcohol dehydrogenase family)
MLVNKPGMFPFGRTAEADRRLFDSTYALNVRGPLFLVGALAPRMVADGGGAFINVTTMVANFGVSGLALYGSMKAALNLLTKAWAAEYGPSTGCHRGLRAHPAPSRWGDDLDQLTTPLPLGRTASAGEVAAAILFLGSDEASYINAGSSPLTVGAPRSSRIRS